MKLKRVLTGTLAGIVLGCSILSGCASNKLIIDRWDSKLEKVREFTEEDILFLKERLDIRYNLKGLSPLQDSIKRFNLHRMEESKVTREYFLVTKADFKFLRAKKWSRTGEIVGYVPDPNLLTKKISSERKTEIIEGKTKPKLISHFPVIAKNNDNKEIGFANESNIPKKEVKKLTDSNGEVGFELVPLIENFDFIIRSKYDKGEAKETLVSKIKDHNLFNEIKKPFRREILPSIINKIETKTYRFRFEPSPQEKSDLDDKYRKRLVIPSRCFYNLDMETINYEQALDQVIKNYVNKKINSKIKKAKICVRNNLSHTGIPNAKVELHVNSPSKYGLAGQYFTGNLLNKSLGKINDYKKGNFVLHTDSKGMVEFPVYCSSSFKIKVTHPSYHFAQSSGNLNEKTLDRYFANMEDIGSKVRIPKDKNKKSEIKLEE